MEIKSIVGQDNPSDKLVSITGLEWQKVIHQARARLKQKMKAPGFRKGHVPDTYFEQHVSPQQILTTAHRLAIAKIDRLLKQQRAIWYYQEYINPEVKEITPEKYSLLFSFEQYRSGSCWKIKKYKDFQLTIAKQQATSPGAQELADALLALKKEYALLKKVARPCKISDWIEIDCIGLSTNNKINFLKLQFELGTQELFLDLEQQIVGMTPLSTKVITATYPNDYFIVALQNQTCDFKITLHQVSVQILPSDDELLLDLQYQQSYSTIQQLREQLQQQLNTNFQKKYENLRLTQLWYAIIKEAQIIPSKREVRYQYQKVNQEFLAQLKINNLSLHEYKHCSGLNNKIIRQQLEQKAFFLAQQATINNEISLREQLFPTIKEINRWYDYFQKMLPQSDHEMLFYLSRTTATETPVHQFLLTHNSFKLS